MTDHLFADLAARRAYLLRLFGDLTITELWEAPTPLALLDRVGCQIAYLDINAVRDNRIADPLLTHHGVVRLPDRGWVAVGFGSTDHNQPVKDTWTDTMAGRLGDVVQMLVHTPEPAEDPFGAICRLAEAVANEERRYNSGEWQHSTMTLHAVLTQVEAANPDEADTMRALVALADPAAVAAVDRLRMWLTNDAARHAEDARLLLNEVAEDTWPALVTDRDSVDVSDVEDFIATVPVREWTPRRAQEHLRTLAADQASSFHAHLRHEWGRKTKRDPYPFDGTPPPNFNEWDFFRNPGSREQWGIWSDEEAASLEARYRD